MHNPIVESLARAVRSRGASPLITWYAPGSGARTELSARSFANWVDKTANLISSWDATGTAVAGPVNLEHPGHWMSLVWPLAAWQAGCTYTTDLSIAASIQVIGPDSRAIKALDPRPSKTPEPNPTRTPEPNPTKTPEPNPTKTPEPNPTKVPEPVEGTPLTAAGVITVACSLHPLGLGLSNLPPGVLDFSSETLSQPDAHYVVDVDPTTPAWIDAQGARDHQQLGVPGVAARVLVRPHNAWQMLADAVIAPLLGGGSAVIIEGQLAPEALARLVASERITSPMA